MEPFLRIDGISKQFGAFTAVKNVSLDVDQGEFFALIGGSGCGKTTLLRILAGFETPSVGRVIIDGQDVTEMPPYLRPVNMMFQSYALFPHMTVAQNVGYGLRFQKMTRTARETRIAEMLDLVKLSDFAARKPSQLSGGQRQRAALARAMAKAPKLLLLDEPLGALDKKLRESTQFELTKLQRSSGVTFIVVTHDQEEAMALASRIAVMEAGEVRQVGRPVEVYEQPQSRFVADFIGSINMFEGRVESVGSGMARIGTAELGLIDAAFSEPLGTGDRVIAAIRPEKFTLGPEIDGLPGVVEEAGYLGKDSLYRVRLDGGAVVSVTQLNAGREGCVPRGTRVGLRFAPAAVSVLRSGK